MSKNDIPWGKFDLASKPDDSVLNIEPDQEGYFHDAAGERFSFNGNRTLRPAHVRMHLNEYHIQEIAKCAEDMRYFIFNYCKVLTSRGWRTPDLRDYQETYLKTALTDNRIVLLQGRQSGKCQNYNTIINIRNKHTGEVEAISVGEFHERIRNKNSDQTIQAEEVDC
jgi:hypothetical protein